MEKIKELVSVIVPNHGRDLTRLVKSVNYSSYTKIELVIVDEGKERSAQRNIGINRARGEYLLFLDSDQEVSPKLIEECVILMRWNFAAVYIPEILIVSGIFGAIRKWERGFYTATVVDVVRFVRADRCPLFDLELNGPEDADFDRRIFGPRAVSTYPVYHNDNISLFHYLNKKAYYSKSMKKFAEKWPGDKCLNIRYRCFWIFIEKGKWKRILCRPDLFLGVIILLFLRGVVYYARR
ncbi:MAG: glycosyltransferase family 2 protein [Candidatus Omnitrophota bacterium]